MLTCLGNLLVNLYTDEEAASLTEYVLLGALIAVGGMVGATFLGTAAKNHLNDVGEAVTTGAAAATSAAAPCHPLAPAAGGSIVAGGAGLLALAGWRASFASAALNAAAVRRLASPATPTRVLYNHRATRFVGVETVRAGSRYDLEVFPTGERLAQTAPHHVQQILSQLRKNA